MQNTYSETLLLRTRDCDMHGSWRPGSILETMQETAGAHSTLCGLSRQAMDDMGLAWIVSRTKVQMQRVPRFSETITIETYPLPNRHMFFPRAHLFRDASGEVVGCANTLWMLMDIAARRVTFSEEVVKRMPDNRGLPSPEGMPATVRALEGNVEQELLLPRFTDFDTNLHVNNIKYLDWCCNALGIEVLQDQLITSFTVNYDAEILPGMQIRTELTRQENRFSFLGFEGDKQHFAVSGTLDPRT